VQVESEIYFRLEMHETKIQSRGHPVNNSHKLNLFFAKLKIGVT